MDTMPIEFGHAQQDETEGQHFFSVLLWDRGGRLDPLLLWSDFMVYSKCKLSEKKSMGRRAEGGTAVVWIKSVLRTVSVARVVTVATLRQNDGDALVFNVV